MKFFIDTADAAEVASLLSIYPVSGVTTNPAIVTRIGKPFETVIRDLVAATNGSLPLFVQVVGTDHQTMLSEIAFIQKIVKDNLIVKIPVTTEGFKTMRVAGQNGIPFTATAIHLPLQAILAAGHGAKFVAPYVSRIDSLQSDGAELVGQIVTELKNGEFRTEVIAASFRTPHQVNQMGLLGVHAVTIAPEMFREISHHPLTESSIKMFSDRWADQYEGATSVLPV